MRSMKISINKEYDLHLRVTQLQYDYICRFSDSLGVSKSDFVRMLIDKNISNLKGVQYENTKANINNQL